MSRQKHEKQSAWLTSELFEFLPFPHPAKSLYRRSRAQQRTRQDFSTSPPMARIGVPASIQISIHAGRWHVYFNYENDIPEPTEWETLDYLLQFSADELRSMTFGGDRGVVLPLAGSDNQQFDFSQIQKKRLAKQEKYRKRWQKRLARRVRALPDQKKPSRK